MKIYLAGPINGRIFSEILKDWEDKADRFKKMGYEVLHPLIDKADGLNPNEVACGEGHNTPVTNNHAIYTRDQWMVRTADIVYADLFDCQRVSIGTMFELAWSSLLGKHIVVCLPKDSLHYHAFVLESANIIWSTREESEKYLETLIKGIS